MAAPQNGITDLGSAPPSSDVVANHLRAAIAKGDYKEGAPIRQDEIAGLFNISKIPVREALKRLEAEGLVEFHRNRGVFVTQLSEPEIEQIFEVRAILEAAVLRQSVPRMRPATLNRATTQYERFHRDEGDVGRWSALNWSFHSSLYEDAGKPFIVRQIRAINDRLERYLRVQLTLADGKAKSDREHLAILDACRAGDAERAAALTHAHIMGACASLLRSLPDLAADAKTNVDPGSGASVENGGGQARDAQR